MVPCSAVLLLHMVPTTRLAGAAEQGVLAGQALQDLRLQLVADSIALAVLTLALILAVYKPRGLTKAGAIAAGKFSPNGSSHPQPAWLIWMRRFFAFAVAGAFLAAHLIGKGLGAHW
jgi:hypothetical protein